MNEGKKPSYLGKFLNSTKIGIGISVIQMLISILFLTVIIKLNILPMKLLIPIIIVLGTLEILIILSQVFNKAKKTCKFISLIICILLAIASSYLYRAHTVIDKISGINTKIDDISVIVLKEDKAQDILDAKDYIFGIHGLLDRENVNATITEINESLETEIKTLEYEDFTDLIEGLYSKEVGVIILNEAYRDIIKDDFQDFDEKTRTIKEHQIETQVEIKDNNKKEEKTEGTENIKQAFNVYISGIDTYGPIKRTSRSDVNIIATINPEKKTILLTTTPRDYYLVFPNSDGMRDKLTHAGIYGVDISVGTLEKLYEIDIDYYVRVNFDSLIRMVDALGGINVNSEYSFRCGAHTFQKGMNNLNGEQALAFSRERYSFAAGDNQRGKNQMAVLIAMIEKATSPTIITNYNSIMKSLENSFETNMTQKEISDYIKMQIEDMIAWKVETNNVSGKGTRKTSYTYKKRALYVTIPDEESVRKAKDLIHENLK